MEHDISHELTTREAQALAHRAIDAYAQRFAKYSPTVAWHTESEAEITFSAKGIKLHGGLTVKPDRFVVRLEVPLLLRPLQGRALRIIDDEVRGWLQRR